MHRQFGIEGTPKGKGRPRFRRNGNAVFTYTDKSTADYEAKVRGAYIEACCGEEQMFEGALRVMINAYFTPPKSTSKREKERLETGNVPFTKKPDADNIAKSVLDGLNGVAFKDDSQVAELIVTKYYNAEAFVRVEIENI